MASPQPEGDVSDHTHVIYLTFTHSFHLTLFTPVGPKTDVAPYTFRPGPTLSSLCCPPSASSSSVSLFHPSLKNDCPLRHGGNSGSRSRPGRRGLGLVRGPHWLLSTYIFSPRCPPALGTTSPTLMPFWWTVETRWCLATLTPTIPPGCPEQAMTGQQSEREGLDGAINSSLLGVANQDLPTRLPYQGQPSSPDITLLSDHLLPNVTWFTLTTLGSDYLPITVSLSSDDPPPPRKARSYTNFRKADWEGFTAESERRFTETPLPTSWFAGEKVFRRILSHAWKHHIPCGHVRNYCGPLPDVVRPFITERDQRRTDDPLNPAIKLLDRDI